MSVFQKNRPAKTYDRSEEKISEEVFHHRVFHASPRDLADGLGLVNAHQVAWRYLHTEPDGRYAAHEVRLGEKEDEHHFNEAQYGAMVDEMKALIPQILALEPVQKTEFELAYLRLSLLRINALWLRANERANDYFIPLSPCFYGLEAGKLYAAGPFLDIAAEAARQFLDHSAKPDSDDMMGG